MPAFADMEQRIAALLSQLTLAEKISLCHASSKFAVGAIERLGIPELGMSDGPHGVRQEISKDTWDSAGWTTDFATYLPTGTALAATWSPELARRFGETLGAEARDRKKDIILGPGINIVRTPLCGRNFEYFSEDPFHIAELVTPVIQGIQSQDVAACVKHYAANNQELARGSVNVEMSERTLREIYLPGFRAAVETAKVDTVMGAYNRFRGQHCCHNEYLVNKVLKGEWGFDGAYVSDWAGTHNTEEAARFGLDIEMGTGRPYDEYFLARPFREAIQSGQLSEELVNDKARRVLRVMFRIGLFSPDRKPGSRNTRAHQQAARAIAQEGIVLLKNRDSVLPLCPATLRRLVVLGDNATAQHHAGGNSSAVKALYEVTPLEGIRAALGDSVQIDYFRAYPVDTGLADPIPGAVLGVADAGAGTNGWIGSYFDNRECQNGPAFTRADAAIDFDWTGGRTPFEGGKPGDFAAHWKTTLTPTVSGLYEFELLGSEHAAFSIGEQQLIQRWENGGPTVVRKTVELQAGCTYPVSLALKPNHADVRLRLGWTLPGARRSAGQDDAAMLQAVRQADAVLFFGGLNHQYDVEGSDRQDLTLPDGQNDVLARIAGLNPRTAVVLVSGSPVELPWLESIPAVVQMWYAGMEGGHAIADVLFGAVAPSGKLPFTFPKSLAESPAHVRGEYNATNCTYREGIYVGYRYFDTFGVEPLFCFGHGLSYTTFAYSDLRIAVSASPPWQATVCCTVRNTGPRAGAEVVQLYLQDDVCTVDRPVRELKGFAKVQLRAGEAKDVQFTLDLSHLSFFCEAAGQWTAEPGTFTVWLGSSSRDLRLSGKLLYG